MVRCDLTDIQSVVVCLYAQRIGEVTGIGARRHMIQKPCRLRREHILVLHAGQSSGGVHQLHVVVEVHHLLFVAHDNHIIGALRVAGYGLIAFIIVAAEL